MYDRALSLPDCSVVFHLYVGYFVVAIHNLGAVSRHHFSTSNISIIYRKLEKAHPLLFISFSLWLFKTVHRGEKNEYQPSICMFLGDKRNSPQIQYTSILSLAEIKNDIRIQAAV